MGSQAGNRLSLRDLVAVQVKINRGIKRKRLTEFRSGRTASFGNHCDLWLSKNMQKEKDEERKGGGAAGWRKK
jgi:hypothetical protein